MANSRHHRPALIYRRFHQARQRQQINIEVQMLRQVVVSLREIGLDTGAAPKTSRG